MNFFERQQRTLGKSNLFYLVFFPVLILSALALCFMAAFFMNVPHLPDILTGRRAAALNLKDLAAIASVFAVIFLAASAYKIMAIKNGGGAYIAQTLGGVLLDKAAAGPAERRLLNAVEEMAVASGLPCPLVFILPFEGAVNAVTIGLDYDDAVIAVTSGAVDKLERDELQAVMAHEFAHILNGDFSLSLTMAGWLHGLVFFSLLGRRLMDIGREAPYVGRTAILQTLIVGVWYVLIYLCGLTFAAVGAVSRLGAETVEAAFSRQREYLADAFAVQFTRSPEALVEALKKIMAIPGHGYIASAQAMCLKSFFVVSPFKRGGLFKSHPPIEDRIYAIDPNWDGRIEPRRLKPAQMPGPAPMAGGAGQALESRAAIGDLGTGLAEAQQALTAMPVELRLAAGDAAGLPALGAALIIACVSPHSDGALQPINGGAGIPAGNDLHSPLAAADVEAGRIVGHFLGEGALAEAGRLAPLIAENHFVPLMNLAAPGFRRLPPDIKRALGRAVNSLTERGSGGLMGLALRAVLKKHLNSFATASPGAARISEAVLVIIRHLAESGAQGTVGLNGAYQAALNHFPDLAESSPEPGPAPDYEQVAAALEILAAADSAVRQKTVFAALSAAEYDRIITPGEYEILRALALALDRPLPISRPRGATAHRDSAAV